MATLELPLIQTFPHGILDADLVPPDSANYFAVRVDSSGAVVDPDFRPHSRLWEDGERHKRTISPTVIELLTEDTAEFVDCADEYYRERHKLSGSVALRHLVSIMRGATSKPRNHDGTLDLNKAHLDMPPKRFPDGVDQFFVTQDRPNTLVDRQPRYFMIPIRAVLGIRAANIVNRLFFSELTLKDPFATTAGQMYGMNSAILPHTRPALTKEQADRGLFIRDWVLRL